MFNHWTLSERIIDLGKSTKLNVKNLSINLNVPSVSTDKDVINVFDGVNLIRVTNSGIYTEDGVCLDDITKNSLKIIKNKLGGL